MFCALPDEAVHSLASFFTCMLASLLVPVSWTVVMATLIPKVVGASNLDKFRGIACLTTARKLLGYLWLQMLPPLRFESFQTGFVPKGHAADGVYVIKRAAELSREWSQKLYIVQVNLKKAFDRVKHSAVIKALKLQGCSLQCLAVLCAILSQSKMAVRLGHVTAPAVDMHRGLPQGAPESPLIFVLVTELVLRPLLLKWKLRGSGWTMDALWLAAACYADDVVLMSSSLLDLENMVREVFDAFLEVGLDVSASKCHWTSYPPLPDTQLNLAGIPLFWEPQIKFVGTVISLGGNDGAALEDRLAQADKVFYRWASFLQFKCVSVLQRLKLLCATVFCSALWLAETWLLTRQQREHLNSWGARIAARTGLVQRKAWEDMGQYWRRLHRFGHKRLRQLGGGLDVRRATRLHSFAGHAARSCEKLMHTALRTRCISWWRYRQARYHSSHDGLHPKRFKCWRWESQLTCYYGEVESEDTAVNVGWMLQAQSRDGWKHSLKAFINEIVV